MGGSEKKSKNTSVDSIGSHGSNWLLAYSASMGILRALIGFPLE